MLLPRFRIIQVGPEQASPNRLEGLGRDLAGRSPQDHVATLSPSTPTDTQPFFPNPTSVTPQTNSNDSNDPVVKTVLEYLFLSIALLLVTAMVIRRFMRLRRDNLPISKFFALESRNPARTIDEPRIYPRTTGIPPVSRAPDGSYMPYPEPHLTGFPSAYLSHALRQPRDPARAADIDAHGRRVADPTIEHDHGGILTDKDVLPAYDSFGGPPKYMEIEVTRPPRVPVVGNPPSRPTLGARSRASDAGSSSPTTLADPLTTPERGGREAIPAETPRPTHTTNTNAVEDATSLPLGLPPPTRPPS